MRLPVVMYTMYTVYVPIVEYATVAAGRAHLKELLDAAEAGTPASMRRDVRSFAVVDAERLRRFLASMGVRAEVLAEDGGWSIFVPGVPVAVDGATFTDAVEAMVQALREYADDWIDHLSTAPNHRDNWGLVQLVSLSNDAELVAWLTAQTQT